MKRALYLLSCYILGFVLGGFATYAAAETIPANYGEQKYPIAYGRPGGGEASKRDTPAEVCAAFDMTLVGMACYKNGFAQFDVNPTCYGTLNLKTAADGSRYCAGPVTWYCESGQNWTLSGQNCTRPDCTAEQTRDPATGQCVSKCAGKAGQEERWWFTYTEGNKPWGPRCKDGCEVYVTGPISDDQNPDGESYISGNEVTERGKEQYSGGSCTSGDGSGGTLKDAPEPNPGIDSAEEPECEPGEGVMTSSSGQVWCFEQGTDGATEPGVQKSKKTETFPDGSTKTTIETKTTDKTTGATHTTTTVIVTGPTGGGGTGQAGTPGTSTSTSNTSTDSNGDGKADGGGGNGTCDPSKDMCGGPGTGGLYSKKTKTFQSVLETFSNGVRNSGMGQAATGFFNVTVPGGSCPSMVVAIDYLNTTLNLSDHFCSSTAIQWMQVAGYVILALASFLAFTWAFL